jgi:hypothetical protein
MRGPSLPITQRQGSAVIAFPKRYGRVTHRTLLDPKLSYPLQEVIPGDFVDRDDSLLARVAFSTLHVADAGEAGQPVLAIKRHALQADAELAARSRRSIGDA